MRVAIALGGTDLGKSGIGTYVKAVLPRLSASLRAQGGSLVALGTSDELAAYDRLLEGTERVVLPGALRAAGPNAAWHLLRAGDAARRARADVLLLPAANRRLTARSRVPTVQVVHDLAQLHVPAKYDALRMFYVRRVVIAALGTATVLVAVSGATARDLRHALGRRSPPIRVVPNGVEHERFAPSTGDADPRVAAARAHTGIVGPYLLYAARLEHPGKNHLRLVRAFASSRARDTHVLALAGGDWGAREQILELVDRRGLADRVKLLGFVPDEILPGLVAGADAVAMLGLHEGFGLPALEALAAGRPVLASRTGALPEVVGSLAALCDPHDDASVRDALERALFDEALRARAHAEGPDWARSHDWQRTADGVLDACREAVRTRPPPSVYPPAR